jgi:hypothetical protein
MFLGAFVFLRGLLTFCALAVLTILACTSAFTATMRPAGEIAPITRTEVSPMSRMSRELAQTARTRGVGPLSRDFVAIVMAAAPAAILSHPTFFVLSTILSSMRRPRRKAFLIMILSPIALHEFVGTAVV